MPRILVDNRFVVLLNMPSIQTVTEPYNLEYVHTVAFVKLSNGRKISCSQNADKGSEVSYMYSRPDTNTGIFTYRIVKPPENPAALPPFEKRSYDKKSRCK
jgi:hypothetical protein